MSLTRSNTGRCCTVPASAVAGLGLSGETAGRLRDAATWKPVEQATMAYGYGLSVSLLQLTRAYMAFANDGEVMPLSFLKREPQEIVGERVFSPGVAREVRAMLETVTQEGGTGMRTRVRVSRGGQDRTAHKLVAAATHPTAICLPSSAWRRRPTAPHHRV